MKAVAAKSVSKDTQKRSHNGLNPAQILNKKSLAAFPTRHPLIQPKLKIDRVSRLTLNRVSRLTLGKPNDKYEQEADRVADQVIRMPEPKRSFGERQTESPLVQRESPCPECKDEEEEKEKNQVQTKPISEQITPLVQRDELTDDGNKEIPEEDEVPEENIKEDEEDEGAIAQPKLMDNGIVQRLEETGLEEEDQEKTPEEEDEEPIQAKPAHNQTPAVTSNIESSFNSLKGGGQPLSESTRSYFEPRFGADFSQVRVHTDSTASETAKSINAKAFTKGKDVVFGSGQYSPGTSEGKRLLGHELTHVVQQGVGVYGKKRGSDRVMSPEFPTSKFSDIHPVERPPVAHRTAGAVIQLHRKSRRRPLVGYYKNVAKVSDAMLRRTQSYRFFRWRAPPDVSLLATRLMLQDVKKGKVVRARDALTYLASARLVYALKSTQHAAATVRRYSRFRADLPFKSSAAQFRNELATETARRVAIPAVHTQNMGVEMGYGRSYSVAYRAYLSEKLLDIHPRPYLFMIRVNVLVDYWPTRSPKVLLSLSFRGIRVRSMNQGYPASCPKVAINDSAVRRYINHFLHKHRKLSLKKRVEMAFIDMRLRRNEAENCCDYNLTAAEHYMFARHLAHDLPASAVAIFSIVYNGVKTTALGRALVRGLKCPATRSSKSLLQWELTGARQGDSDKKCWIEKRNRPTIRQLQERNRRANQGIFM